MKSVESHDNDTRRLFKISNVGTTPRRNLRHNYVDEAKILICHSVHCIYSKTQVRFLWAIVIKVYIHFWLKEYFTIYFPAVVPADQVFLGWKIQCRKCKKNFTSERNRVAGMKNFGKARVSVVPISLWHIWDHHDENTLSNTKRTCGTRLLLEQTKNCGSSQWIVGR